MAKKRISKQRREYNQLFASLPPDRQDAHLSFLWRLFLGIIGGDPPPPPPPPEPPTLNLPD